jgi:hypothetical protein
VVEFFPEEAGGTAGDADGVIAGVVGMS